MPSLSDALQGVLMLLVLILVGVLMARRGVLTDAVEKTLSRIAIGFAIPALLCTTTISRLSVDFLGETGWFLLLPFAVLLIGYALAMGLCRLFRVPSTRRGVFCMMFSMSNAVFIGLPVIQALFGEEALPWVVTYFPSNTVIFWTLGNLGILRDGGGAGKSGGLLKKIFSPPLLGFLAGLAIVLSGIQLPPFALSALTYLGGLTVPISLLTTGAALSRMGKASLRVPREGWLALSGRLVIMPGLTLGACLLLGAPPDMTAVYTMLSAMPVMSQGVIMARNAGADYELASQMLTLSTLVSLAWIPLVTLALGWIL